MVTKTRVCICIAVVWLFSIFYSTIQFSWLDVDNHNITQIGENIIYEKPYNITGVFLCFSIPLCVMILCFARMFCVIRRQVGRIQKQAELSADPRSVSIASDKRALIIFFTMLCVYTLCWLTWYLTLFQVAMRKNVILPEKVADVFDFLRFGTSLFNPLLYTFLKMDFRRAVSSLYSNTCASSIRDRCGRSTHLRMTSFSTDMRGRKSLTPLNGAIDGLTSRDFVEQSDFENNELITSV